MSLPRRSSTSPDSKQPPKYTFFTDRDLGTAIPKQLRDAGLRVEALEDHFPARTRDQDWYPMVGQRGWLAITHDKGQWRKTDEREAAMREGVALFIVVGRMPHSAIAELLARMAHKIEAFRDRHRPPFIAKIYRPDVRTGLHFTKPGRIEMVLSADEWRDQQMGTR